MYGAIPIGSFFGISDVLKEYDAGGTFALGDFVKMSSGELVVATAGDALFGLSNEAATSASVKVQVNITPGLEVIMDNDDVGTTFAATLVGTLFDITGATGAQIVDTSTTGATGQLYCWGYNPQGFGFNSDTSIGRFSLSERPFGV